MSSDAGARRFGSLTVASNVLERIDRLKRELDGLRLPNVIGRVEQKLWVEANYHSNAIEGNSLTLDETRRLILHGLTAHGKPPRDHLDIEGHDQAIKAVEAAVREEQELTDIFIRNLHKVPCEVNAATPDGKLTKRLSPVGAYKTVPNNVRTSTGETYYYTPPEQTKPAMSDPINRYTSQEAKGEHPVIVDAAFHYRFVRMHPFDDGNGRMARLLMNLILIKHGHTVAIVPREDRNRYIPELERLDKTEDLTQFIEYITSCCAYASRLSPRAARGESIEDAGYIGRGIADFKRRPSVQGMKTDRGENVSQYQKTSRDDSWTAGF